MKKIPTLFVRDENDRRYVTPQVSPECKWVLDGEGVATRKYDGTCVGFDGEKWWARREVKPGKTPPPGWVEVAHDETTDKRVGWEHIAQSPFAKFFDEAYRSVGRTWRTGSYELCGPKVQGNPEGYETHTLVEHYQAERLPDAPRDFDELREWLTARQYEGIVWHHPDGRLAKLKRRDFA